MRFHATEAGYKDGMGGASYAKSERKYHYVLFDRQADDQHPSNCGIYLEYDDQVNGTVNGVERILVSGKAVKFLLADSSEIVVGNDVTEVEWQEFLRGIDAVFGPRLVRNPKRPP